MKNTSKQERRFGKIGKVGNLGFLVSDDEKNWNKIEVLSEVEKGRIKVKEAIKEDERKKDIVHHEIHEKILEVDSANYLDLIKNLFIENIKTESLSYSHVASFINVLSEKNNKVRDFDENIFSDILKVLLDYKYFKNMRPRDLSSIYLLLRSFNNFELSKNIIERLNEYSFKGMSDGCDLAVMMYGFQYKNKEDISNDFFGDLIKIMGMDNIKNLDSIKTRNF